MKISLKKFGENENFTYLCNVVLKQVCKLLCKKSLQR